MNNGQILNNNIQTRYSVLLLILIIIFSFVKHFSKVNDPDESADHLLLPLPSGNHNNHFASGRRATRPSRAQLIGTYDCNIPPNSVPNIALVNEASKVK